ncbi:MAG TPA: glycosyltransferase family 2 protein [Beijerinckiaceae bacterium]|nr:glycosyltransferase family 2 protein [Beijerinckiaceae bacterium]
MSAAPRVTIVVPAYNAADCIGAALDSVLAQSMPDFEVIVVDDGSRDATVAVVQNHARRDPRVVLVRQERNGGVSAARNAALDRARGVWITVLDSDDTYRPERLEVLLAAAERHDLAIVADNLLMHDDGSAGDIGPSFAFDGPICRLTRDLLVRNDSPPLIVCLGHLKPMFRRDLIERTGLRYPTDIAVGEDFHFLFCLLGLSQRAALLHHAGYRYTLPFNVLTGSRASGSRTAYGLSSLDTLARSNALLAETLGDSPDTGPLRALLQARGRMFPNEKHWRRLREHVHSRALLAALKTIVRVDPSFTMHQIAAYLRRRGGRFDTVLHGVEPFPS